LYHSESSSENDTSFDMDDRSSSSFSSHISVASLQSTKSSTVEDSQFINDKNVNVQGASMRDSSRSSSAGSYSICKDENCEARLDQHQPLPLSMDTSSGMFILCVAEHYIENT